MEDGLVALQSEELSSLEKVRGAELQFLKRVRHLQHVWILLSVVGAAASEP